MTGDEQVDRRRVFETVTPEQQRCTLVVVRLGYGQESEVWLSFHGVTETTAVMHLAGAQELAAAIEAAAA